MIRPLLIALQFLTRLPVRLSGHLDEKDLGRSLLFYPLIGLLLGGLLVACAWLLGAVAPLLAGALILTGWVTLTGALHLDGLADTVDAWAGGQGDPDRTLAIMKDPRSGPLGVTALILVLILKFTSLVAILEAGAAPLLVLAPVLGRTALPLLFLTTPYVRPGGLGAVLARALPVQAALGMVLVSYALVPIIAGKAGWLALAVALTTFISLRQTMNHRIQGTTGDTAGALVEITEVAVLIALAV